MIKFEKEPLSLQLASAKLVVLSECDSFKGELRADGVIGITRAFVAAGAPTLLATLWKVSDSATRVLMTRFYDRLLGEVAGDAAAALQGTMVSMIRAGFKPNEWASFVCYGLASGHADHQFPDTPADSAGASLQTSLHELLGISNLASKLEEALSWFTEHDYESIEQMLEAGTEQEFVNALQLKPGKAKLLRIDLKNYASRTSDVEKAASANA